MALKRNERWLARGVEAKGAHRLFGLRPELRAIKFPNGSVVSTWRDDSWPGTGEPIIQAELPRNLRLALGEGPVLVRIEITRVED